MEQPIQPGTVSSIMNAITTIISSFISSDASPLATNLEIYTNMSNADSLGQAAQVTFIRHPLIYTYHDPHMKIDLPPPVSQDGDDDDSVVFLLEHSVCCAIMLAFEAIQYIVVGPLRVSERQHLRETFWDYFVQKSLFVFFILDANSGQERSSWAVWFTVLGSILLLSKLCRDRFEYLTSSPTTKKWPLIKIGILMTFLLITAILCNLIIPITNLSTHTLFLIADASYVLTFVTSVITRFILLTYDMRPNSALERSASITYYTDLFFFMAMLSIELLHHSHLLIVSNKSMTIRGICLMKIHTLLMELRRRYRRHKHYLIALELMESNFSVASQEEIENFGDECAICWDSMEKARKLPCGHLFHNSCLRSWLEQDTSCPTCRISFKGQQRQHDELIELANDSSADEENEELQLAPPHPRNHLFHFDSSRYTNNPLLRWLPTVSIEGFI